jgi:spermidine/putrescine transport system permease protein
VKRRLPGWLVALTGLGFIFLHLPILVLIVFSFNASRFSVHWTGFTLDWYLKLLDSPLLLRGLKLSLIIAVAATLLATILGTLLALALARHRVKGRQGLEGLLILPIVTPEIVVGISLLVFFTFLHYPLGVSSVVIAHVAFSISFVVVVVLARLHGMDRSLEEAALNLGADEVVTFWKVTVPLLLPGIIAAGLLAFTLSFDDFLITFFVAGVGSSTLPLVVYSMVRLNVSPTVNAISTIIVLASTLTVMLADRFTRSRTALPAGARPKAAATLPA